MLLKNDGVLPLTAARRLEIAVIGGHAQEGVVSGTGSGAVLPVGGFAGVVRIGGPGVMGAARNLYLFRPSPLAELRKHLPNAQLEFDPGYTPAEAALMAKRSDLVIAFGIRVEGEGFDSADLSLPWGQDTVIDAVATANPNTIVVLEAGNPVSMPWRDKVKAIVQAWYPGQAGAQAIAEVLTGAMNPSGRLPITFPADLAQTPRPELPGLGTPWGTPTTIRYDEGAEVGYRWYANKNIKPLYPFGHENFATRNKILVQSTLRLRYGTTSDQVRSVLHGVRDLLARHPAIETTTGRIRLVNFGERAIELELFAYVLTPDVLTFLAVREDLLLQVAAIIESSGTAFAQPTIVYKEAPGDVVVGSAAGPRASGHALQTPRPEISDPSAAAARSTAP